MSKIAKRVRAVLGAALVLVVALATGIVGVQSASALSAGDWNSGMIISDKLFYDANAMSEAEIQAFLLAGVGGWCGNNNCLTVARTNTTSRGADAMCNPYSGASAELTSTIIFKVQQACGISAKVLLVTLQKEQGLITNPSPSAGTLERAMGYACPDSANGGCDPSYAGLYNQLYRAAWQFKRYGNPPGTSNFFTWFPVGRASNIQWNPNPGCGSSSVVIQNAATAALYYYTPYQPNGAALVNLGGTGDGCSSYGNRNFWVYYNQWFGSTLGTADNPVGNVELIQPVAGGVQVDGWALDPNSSASLTVHVYVDGVATGVAAVNNRPDVAAAYPNAGAAHGFSVKAPVTFTGQHQVCIWALNVGPGSNTLFGCATVTAMAGSPVGYIESASGVSGGIDVKGWALDPDTAGPITVHAYVDGVIASGLTANVVRADVAKLFPAYGGGHGFGGTVPASPGVHQVCTFGINVLSGANTMLGCLNATVPTPIVEMARTPIGFVDEIAPTSSGANVSGWAIDPDTTASITVHVYVDGVLAVGLPAVYDRADVAAVYPAYGAKHGYSGTVALTPGTHQVCVFGINTGPGGNSVLGCRSITIGSTIGEQGRSPIGWIETAVAAPTGITVGGWALDPDTTAPITVHIYIDGVLTGGLPAVQSRADVAGLYPAYGPTHGFSGTVPAAPGKHSVCAFGINAGPGPNSMLGCISVTK